MLYHVIGRVEYVYEIEADTPEYAARVVEEGDGGLGEAVDAWIQRVQVPGGGGEYDPGGAEVRRTTEPEVV